jgi:signal transduction histidine kinase
MKRNDRSDVVTNNGAARCHVIEEMLLEKHPDRARKLETIGTLAGGIAHEFNNILGVICGYTELALDEIPAESRAQGDLENVLAACRRAEELVNRILLFSRQDKGEKKPLRIADVVEDVLKQVRSTLPASIEIRKRLEVQSGIVTADPASLHMVLTNLCSNAVQAMDRDGGTLEIGVAEILLDMDSDPVIYQFKGIEPGSYMVLSVKDTGCGIDPAHVERIFDPFFTTKPVGIGIGLGLSVTYGIVKRLGGDITVSSEPGRGSLFRVVLPSYGSVPGC